MVCFQPPTLLIVNVFVPVMVFVPSGKEARIVSIGFSAAVDTVNNKGILFELCFMSIEGSVSSILTQFLLNLSQHVMVDDCRSKLVIVVSAVPQGSILGPLLFILYTSELCSILEISSVIPTISVVPSPALKLQ